MNLCDCNLTLSNKGVPGRQPLAGVLRRHIVVPLVADDGTENYIDLNTVDLSTYSLAEAYFQALINQADPSKRWYPMPLIDNVSDVRAESKKETLNSGQNIFVEQGVRSFSGVMVKQSTTMLDKMQGERCVEFGVYEISKNKQLVGRIDEATNFLYPIKIDKETWDATLVKTTDSTVQKIQLMFDYDQTEEDRNLRLLCFEEDLSGYDLLKVNGLLDVVVTISGISTTGFTAKLELVYGSALTKIPVTGWVKADFDLYNVTDSAAIVITSVTESLVNDGEYVFVMPAQTSADVCRLTKNAGRLGFELPAATLITIP